MSNDETEGDAPRIRFTSAPSETQRDRVFDAYLFPLDDPHPLNELEELIASLPTVLSMMTNAFLRNLEAVVSVGTLPYQMASAAVAQRRFDSLWIAEQIRARQHVDESGKIPEWALHQALEKAKQRMSLEVKSPEVATQMADHVIATLSEDLTNETFRSACEELLRQAAVLIWGALEVLAKDLFVMWLNMDPRSVSALAKDERTKKRFQLRSVSLDTLEQFNFDLSKQMGNLLSEVHDVTDLASIREIFDVLCRGESAPRSALGNQELWMLYQKRNLVVHRRGVVDQAYLDNTGDNVALGTVMQVTPDDLDKYLRCSVRVGAELLRSAARILNV